MFIVKKKNILYIIFILLLFFLVILGFFSNYKYGKVISFVITLFILYSTFLFISYTPDRDIYTWMLYYRELSKDKEPIFNLIANYVRNHNYDYEGLHFIYLLLYCFLYLMFVSKFIRNVLPITLLYIPLVFIFFGTQLRFFLGYFFVLLSLYYLLIKKNKLLTLSNFVLGIANHYSLVLFIPFYFLYRIKEKFFIKIIQISFYTFIGYLVLTNIIFNLLSGIRFVSYLKGDLVSTYLGGIFTFVPIIPIYFLINFYYKKRIKLEPSLKDDEKFTFLYKMSITPLIFIGIAFTVQVIGHRIIMTCVLFPILLFFYKFNEIKNLNFKINAAIIFALSYSFIFFHFNLSTGFILGKWDGIEQIEKMIKSNPLLEYLIS